MNAQIQRYRDEYIARINRVIDYIQNNLNAKLDLDTLAKIAFFSKFHFHRIFTAMVGETLNSFIKRLRIEKAASTLIAHPKDSITKIAFDCGFSSSAAFSRAFNEHFGINATDFRNDRYKNSKIRKIDNKDRKATNLHPLYFNDGNSNQIRSINMKVEVKKLEDLTVAYVRHIGPYAGDSTLFDKLFGKLFKWAGPRGLVNFPKTKMLSIYYDDPKITDESKLRMDVCISISEDTEVSGEIGKMTIAGGKYAVGRFEIKANEYGDAWNNMMGKWLPDSGYVPDDQPCFEMYQNDPKQHPQGLHIVDICIPVKPL
ncbi:AraC family transcriptional regulator [bacterium]|nr:AraC family transcriptional regulator [bacterium]